MPQDKLEKALLNRRKYSPEEYAFREYVTKPKPVTSPKDVPPGFRPEPPMMGSPRLGRLLREVFQLAPELQGTYGIRTQPTGKPLDKLFSALPHLFGTYGPGMTNDSNLLGAVDRKDKAIYINEDQHRNENELYDTIVHEFSHGVGNALEFEADKLGEQTAQGRLNRKLTTPTKTKPRK
jgi:hypothetical protein